MSFRLRAFAVIPLVVGVAGFVYAVSEESSSRPTEQEAGSGAVAVGNTRFCPGIPAGDLADGGFITIANTADIASEARITWLGPSGRQTKTVTVEPHTSTDVIAENVDRVASAIVELDVPGAIVEQHSESEAGNIRTLCTDRTATSWYFADGFTASDSNELLVLTNPYADAAIIDLSYSTVAGRQRPNEYQGFVIPPKSVRILDVASIGARNEQVVSFVIEASTGRIIAGRVQRYRGSGRQGLTVSLGATRTSGDWWFAFGDTSANTAEQLVVYNPGEKPVSVEVAVTGFKPKSAIVQPFTIEVNAGRSAVIDMNGVLGLPPGNHGISVVTLGTGEIVVERVINVIAVNGQIATTVSSPLPQASLSQQWDIAEVQPGERIAIVNVTGTRTQFAVTSFGPAGEVAITGLEAIALAPGACVIVTIPDLAPTGPVRVSAGASVIVEYVSSRGAGRIGYSVALAQTAGAE